MRKRFCVIALFSVVLLLASCGTSDDIAYKDTEAYQKALDQAEVSTSEESGNSSNTVSVETGSSYDGSSVFEDGSSSAENSSDTSLDALSGIELDSVSADEFFATDNENLEAITQEEAQENANLNYGIVGSSSSSLGESDASDGSSYSGDFDSPVDPTFSPSDSSEPTTDTTPDSSGELSIGVNKTVKNSSKYDLEKLAESTKEFRQYPRYSPTVWFNDSIAVIGTKSISYDDLYLFADSFATVSSSGKKKFVKSFSSSGELLCELLVQGTVNSISYAYDSLFVLSSKGSGCVLTCCPLGSPDAWSLDLSGEACIISDSTYDFKKLPISCNSRYVVVDGVIYSLSSGKLLKDTKQSKLFATKSGFVLIGDSVGFYDHSLKLVKRLEDSFSIKALSIAEYVVLSSEKKTFVFDSEGRTLKSVPLVSSSIHALDFDSYSIIDCGNFSFVVLKNSIIVFSKEVQRKSYINASVDLDNSCSGYLCYEGTVLDVSSGVELNMDYAGIFIGDDYLFVYSDANFYLLNKENEVILGKDGTAYPLDSSSVLRLKGSKWRIISTDLEPIQFVSSNDVVNANNSVIQVKENDAYSLYSIVF